MAETQSGLVSIIVPHYNDLDNLKLCLDRLRRQTRPKDRYEIIVADNNSRVGIDAVRGIAPGVVVVSAAEQGAGLARNAGVAVARGETFAFIDSDCLAHENWLAEGLAALRGFDYVGGKVITTIRDPHHVTAAEGYEAEFAFNFERYIRKHKFSGAGNLFVPRAVFEKVGGFRAGVSEDVDWCRRANALGFRLGYAAKAVVEHAARRKWGDLTRKWDRVIAERLALESERPGWRARWLIRAVAVALSPFVHMFCVLGSRRLIGLRAKAMGLVGLFGIRFYRAYRMVECVASSSARA